MALLQLCLEPLNKRLTEPESASDSSVLFPANESFEVEPAYEDFIVSCPPPNATIPQVRAWIRFWFDVSGAFLFDVALQPYIDRIDLSGFLLHSLKKKQTFFDYLDSLNKIGERADKLYDDEVLVCLTNYIFVAKEDFMARPLTAEEIDAAEKLYNDDAKAVGEEKNKKNIKIKGNVKGKTETESKAKVIAKKNVIELPSPREVRERQFQVFKGKIHEHHKLRLAAEVAKGQEETAGRRTHGGNPLTKSKTKGMMKKSKLFRQRNFGCVVS